MSNFSQFQELTVHLSKLRKMSAKSQSELLKPYDISNRHATYIIALSEDNGMTMKELSQLMYELGCTVAYNLDGGGTAIMADAFGAISRQSNSERRCSDILFIVEDYTAFWTRAGEEDGA